MNKKVRTRFSPSPTGPLHIGGIRTALYNYLFAKKHGGDFILRIEDTDSKREVAGSVNYIYDSLSWLGINFDESPKKGGTFGPYIQSKRSHLYKKYVDMLIESGNAYYAFDTAEELKEMKDNLTAPGVKSAGYTGSVRDRMKNSISMPAADVKNRIGSGESYVVRFKMPRAEDVKFKDEIRGYVTFNTKDLDDKVIWKSSDGLPTYHLANIVDDYLMEITHVIRGEEWVSSTPLHILLYRALGWEHPIFAHLPLILGPDKKKLGKRNKYGIPVFALNWTYTDPEGEVVDIKGFREAGYEPDAFINYLALLGWNPGGNVEHMTPDEMTDYFSVERVNNSGAMFDLKKLDSFNAHYLRNRSVDWILEKMTLIPSEFLFAFDDAKKELIANIAVDRVTFAKELGNSMGYIWSAPELSEEIKLKNVDEFVKVMNIFVAEDFMINFDEKDWTIEYIRMKLESISTAIGSSVGKIMPMLRLALTGGVPGPQLPEIMYIIGPKETKNRIDVLLGKVKESA